MARRIDCPCGHVLRGADDEELFRLARIDDEVRAGVVADARDE